MWLIVSLIAAVAVTAVCLMLKKGYRKKFKLSLLALMLLGTFLMILVDHVIAFIGGEPFIEVATDGLVNSGTILGILMIIPIFVIWIIAVLIQSGTTESQS